MNAALANGMFAHADETDDFEPVTKAHPGCAVVPAALAMAEREGRSGAELLAAVTLGYDVCCRFLLALGPDHVRASHRSAEGTSSTMGAVAAAASLARLDEKGMRYALSYAAQQVSGVWSWVRDAEHVEKAFDFSGMGARNGVTAAIMAQTGVYRRVGRARRRAQRAAGAVGRAKAGGNGCGIWEVASSSPKLQSSRSPSAIRFRRRSMRSSSSVASTG